MGYTAKVIDGVYPKENRVLAGVAALRTFKQTIKAAVITTAVGGGAAVPITVSSSDLSGLALPVVAISVGVLVVNAFIAAAVAWDDVAQNGLSSKYAEAVEDQIKGKYGDYSETEYGVGETE